MEPILAVVGLLIALPAGGLLAEILLEQRDRRRCPPPGQRVKVGEKWIHLVCCGQRAPGAPLVVLEAGMASWSFYWRLVQPVVAQFARVCAYDRPGLGWSDARPGQRTAAQVAEVLEQALRAAGEPGPYLLVGHSLGGVFVRQFARLYAGEVAGMVLVDSAHEDQLERMPWARQEASRLQIFFSLLAALHRLGVLRLMAKSLLARFTSLHTPQEKDRFRATLLASRYFETSRDESLILLRPLPPDERLAGLGAKPLVIIQAVAQPQTLPRGYSPERWQEQRRAWDGIQRDLLALSANSRLVLAENSVHAVQVEQPEIVIEAIRAVIWQLAPAEQC